MAFVFRYTCSVEWTDAPGLGMNAAPGLQGGLNALGQHLQFYNTSPVGSGTFTATDINAFMAAMQTDLAAQLTVSVPRIQLFSSGGG